MRLLALWSYMKCVCMRCAGCLVFNVSWRAYAPTRARVCIAVTDGLDVSPPHSPPSDDQGFGDVGFNAVPSRQYQPGAGGAWKPNPPRTPHLDAWAGADSSIVFERAYSGSPVCSPTRSSLLTGRTPDRECVFNAEGCGQTPAWECVDPMPFPASVPTLPRTLAGAGYATAHFGECVCACECVVRECLRMCEWCACESASLSVCDCVRIGVCVCVCVCAQECVCVNEP